MGNGVCAGCRFDRVTKLETEKYWWSVCTNPKKSYSDDGKTMTGISTDNNFQSCDDKKEHNETDN